MTCNNHINMLAAGEGFFKYTWPVYTDLIEMLAACEQLCERHGYTATQLHVFLDYISIPQRNMRLRLCAIDSLGVFASIAKHFVVVAPSAIHKDTQQICDKASYARRGWYAPKRFSMPKKCLTFVPKRAIAGVASSSGGTCAQWGSTTWNIPTRASSSRLIVRQTTTAATGTLTRLWYSRVTTPTRTVRET